MASKQKEKAKSKRKTWPRWLFGLIGKLAFIGLVATAFYLVYLDSMLTKRFADTRYEAPALLYSRALLVTPEDLITREQIIREFRALDYRENRYARNPGEFQQQGSDILLFRRAFDFPDQLEPGIRVRLRFDQNDRLVDIESWPEQTALKQLRLEPQLIGRFASDNNEDRLLVGLEQIPVLMQQTLLLVEDQDFYHHHGVKPSAIARAAMANLAAGRTVQGGSTITQQLIKNMYLSRAQTLTRKVNEALMALVLDFRFSKDEILEAYFNEVFYGQDRGHAIHGVGLASRYFYGKSPEDLTPAEIAMLVGMVKGPSLYNPYRNPETAASRRDLVLRLMYSDDLINQPQYLAALEAPAVTRASNRLVARAKPDYVDYVKQELRTLVPGSSWQETGLRVFTYFDPWLQTITENAVSNRMELLPDLNVQAAAIVTDYRAGTIRALVGGRAPVLGGFNRAFQARRPIGSLIKPFVYSLALEQENEFSLASIISDEALTIKDERGREWQPSNFDEEFKGRISLYQSWIDSRNIPAIQTALTITPAKVRDRLYSIGATGAIHAYPSLALGTIDLSPIQVNEIYGYLANNGRGYKLSSIAGVTTHRGELIYLDEREPRAGYRPEAAYLARYASYGVVEHGTGRALGQELQAAIGGKTGSTNDLRDSWFVSFDNRHILTVWLGRDDNQPIGLTGSTGALPLAAEFWQNTHIVPLNLTPPSGVEMLSWDSETGLPVSANCENTLEMPGIMGDREISDCQPQQQEEEEPPQSWWRRIFGE